MNELNNIEHVTNEEKVEYKNRILLNDNSEVYITETITKTWYYYNKLENFVTLKYIELNYNNNKEKTSNLYKRTLNNNFILINDISDFITSEKQYIKQSQKNYINAQHLKSSISDKIGNYTFSTFYEFGWNIKDLLVVTIGLYSNNEKIIVNYKNQDLILTIEKLELLIEKNKKAILKQIEETKNIKIPIRLDNYIKPPTTLFVAYTCKTKNSDIDNFRENCTIKKTIKEKYKMQSCKEFVEKYEWNM